MSASQDPKSNWIYSPTPLNAEYDALYISMLECEFDVCTDDDVEEITHQMMVEAKLNKFYRKICMIRVFSFPTDFVMGFILLGKSQAKAVFALHKAMWKFLFKRATRKDLNDAISQFSV